MHRFSLSGANALLISVLLMVCFHLLPGYQYRQRHTFLAQPQTYLTDEQLPSWANVEQKAYLTYLRGEKEQAVLSRTDIASGSTEHDYNLGTLLAMMSVISGEVTDLKRLQQAEKYLSGATAHDETRRAELDHNLAMVRKLLQEQQQQNQEQNQEPQTGSGEQQQENQEEQTPSGTEQQEQKRQQEGQKQEQQLSEAMKQQLEQYQQQLLGEQAQNQQFFDKHQAESEQNDPFNRLQELFGGDPQLQQELGGSEEKDW